MNRNVRVLIASDPGKDGRPKLSAADRAAVCWGVQTAGARCQVGVPENDSLARSYALACGALCETRWEPRDQTADLVLIGTGALDRAGEELAGRWAERLSATLLFDVLRLDPDEADWRITCDAGRGARDILRVRGPLVLAVSPQAPRPPYISRFRLQQAAKLQPMTLASDEQPVPWQSVIPRVRKTSIPYDASAESRASAAFGIGEKPSGSGDSRVLDAPPAEAAQILLRYLVHHGLIIRTLPEDLSPIGTTYGDSDQKPVAVQSRQRISISDDQRRGPQLKERDETDRVMRRPRRAVAFVDFLSTPLQRRPRRVASPAPCRGPYRSETLVGGISGRIND